MTYVTTVDEFDHAIRRMQTIVTTRKRALSLAVATLDSTLAAAVEQFDDKSIADHLSDLVQDCDENLNALMASSAPDEVVVGMRMRSSRLSRLKHEVTESFTDTLSNAPGLLYKPTSELIALIVQITQERQRFLAEESTAD